MKLYKYFKPGCYPCTTVTAILKRVDLPEDVELVEIDASLEENKHLLVENKVEKVPVLLFENGKRLYGVKPKIILQEWINGYKNWPEEV